MRSHRLALWMAFGSLAVTLAVACGSSSSGDAPGGGAGDGNDGSVTTGDPGVDGGGGKDGDGGKIGDGGADLDGSIKDASTVDAHDGGAACAAAEVCDGVVDDNCNGVVDEGCGRCPLLQIACAAGCCAVDRWQVDTAASDNGSSIAVDDAGDIFFAYTLPNSGIWASALAVYDAVPGTWRKVDLGSGSYRNRVIVDKLGRVHVLYGTSSGNYAINYVRSDDHAHTFSAPVVVGYNAIGGSFDMAVDSLDRPHVVYGAAHSGTYSPNLTYTHLNGASWVSETLDTTTSSPDYPDLELGFMDRPHIVVTAYHPDGEATTTKRHVFNNGNRWVYENFDALPAGSSYPSGYFTAHSLYVHADGSAEVLFTRSVGSTTSLFLSLRGPGDDDVWATSPITGVTNVAYPTLFIDGKGHRAAVSDGISVHREGVASAWTSSATGLPGEVVAQARRGRYLYLGYSDTSNGNKPTVSVVDLGP